MSVGDLDTSDFVTAALSLLAVIVSVISFMHTKRTGELARKPVLVFEYEGTTGWILRNVGSGPALSVIVAQKKPGGDWFNPVRVPPLSKDGTFVPRWLDHVNTTGLGATYTDTEQKPYTSTCGNDLSQTFEGALFGPWPEAQIGRHWNQSPYVDDKIGGINGTP